MNKILVLLLSVLVLGGGTFFFVQHKGLVPKLRDSDKRDAGLYLPRDTVAISNLLHLAEISRQFPTTPLGRFFARETMDSMLDHLDGGLLTPAQYDHLFNQIGSVVNHPVFQAAFGGDVTVALLTPGMQGLQNDPMAALRRALVVIARTTETGVHDFFAGMAKKTTVSQEKINGLNFTKIVFSDQTTVYSLTQGNTVLLAYDPAVIGRCLATAEQPGQSLSESPVYQAAVQYWAEASREKTYLRLFVQPQALAQLADSLNPQSFSRYSPEALQLVTALQQSAARFKGMDGLYGLLFAGDHGLEGRIHVAFQYDQLSPLIKATLDSATSPNPTISLLREDTLLYFWASDLRLDLLKDALLKGEDQGAVIMADGYVHQFLGLGIDDLARTFGPQYGLVFNDIVPIFGIPVPKLTLFVSHRDQAMTRRVVDALRGEVSGSGILKEGEEQVQGQTLYSWPLWPDDNLQPALVATDTRLYASSSKRMLKDILTAQGPPTELVSPVAEQMGESLARRVGRANLMSVVLYPQRMVQPMDHVFTWLARNRYIPAEGFRQQLETLMQSTDLLAFTFTADHKQGDWSMSLHLVPAEGGGTTK